MTLATPRWYDIATQDLLDGVAEIPGSEHHPRILEYHQHTSLAATEDEVANCASAVSCWIEEAGYQSAHSARARDHMRPLYRTLWRIDDGIPLPADLPLGAVCVMARGRATRPEDMSASAFDRPGHVFLWNGWDQPGYVLALGANQGDRVQVSTYGAWALLYVGWPVRRLA